MEWEASRPRLDSFTSHLPSVSHEAQLRSHEDLLRRLYVTENKTTKAVMDYMESHFQLKVGVSTYTRVFRELNFRKNAKGDHWAYVDDRIRKRQHQGKPSRVYAQGRLVEPKKVKKEIARHVSTLQQIASATGPGPASPDGWSVKTPRTEDDTIMKTPEDVAMVIDDDETIAKLDVEAAGAPRGNTTEPINITTQSGYRTEGVGLLQLQLQASSHFHPSFQSPIQKSTFNDQVGHLAMQLLACKAFITFSSPPFASWDWPEAHYNDIARDIMSVVPGSIFASRYSSIPSYDDALQIMAYTMWNHTDSLHLALANRFGGFGRGQRDDILRTALFLTATYGLVDAAHTLIFLGADLSETDIYGDTCLRVAEKHGHYEIVALLWRHETKFFGKVADRAAPMGVAVKEAADPGSNLESRTDVEGNSCAANDGENFHGKAAGRVAPMDIAAKEAIDLECKPRRRTDAEESSRAPSGARKGTEGSGPLGFNKWFESVVMPWAQRNWGSLGSSFSFGSFRVKLPSRPPSGLPSK